MDRYFEALRGNLEEGLRSPQMTELVSALDAAYKAIIDVPPSGHLIFARLLLICHKSMLSAAAMIAGSQPEDSMGVTRRAIEVAQVALAIKLNDDNAEQWTSYQKRHERWITRQSGERPKPFRVEFKNVKGDPLMDEVNRWLGIVSDAYVHFTPEFYDSLDWSERRTPEGDRKIFLNYFQSDEREIERHFNGLAAVHVTILKVFDRCFDGGISGDQTKSSAVGAFIEVGKRMNDNYRQKYRAEPLVDGT